MHAGTCLVFTVRVILRRSCDAAYSSTQ